MSTSRRDQERIALAFEVLAEPEPIHAGGSAYVDRLRAAIAALQSTDDLGAEQNANVARVEAELFRRLERATLAAKGELVSPADKAKAEALLVAIDEMLAATNNPPMALAIATRMTIRILEGAHESDPAFVRGWLAHFNTSIRKRLGLDLQ
jgi:hypothetical protein